MTDPTPHRTTSLVRYPEEHDAIMRGADCIRQNGLVAVPTETVYGLAANAMDAHAIANIYAAKGRPDFNPLIIHVQTAEDARKYGIFTEISEKLAARFWPGPLTMILPRTQDCKIASIATAGLATIAMRVPDHPAMQAMLAITGLPLAAPSANASGSISPRRAEHVLRSLDGRIDLIIDAGPTTHGLESTIVTFVEDAIILLRPGPITPAMLEQASGLPVYAEHTGKITAPGQLASHYAPSKPVTLNTTSHMEDQWLIGFGDVPGHNTLSGTGDLIEAAARLFDCLHEADESDASTIAVAPVPSEGIGLAINDRLSRAAAHKTEEN